MPFGEMTITLALTKETSSFHMRFGVNRGAHHRMSWLQNTYDELIVIGSYEVVARAYMLYIVACTIFADKSGVYIDAQHVCLFGRLEVAS